MCKVQGCMKRYTDPSSLRKHVKTFNHDSVNQNLKISERSDESMDCELASNHDLIETGSNYYNSITYSDHLKSTDSSCWESQSEEITDRMEIIKLDQPLDLRLRQDR